MKLNTTSEAPYFYKSSFYVFALSSWERLVIGILCAWTVLWFVVHFCKLHTVSPSHVLLLNRTPIAVVEQVKFLDLIFDNQLSFIPHLRYLKQKCLKALNLLRVVSSIKFGTDEKTLLHLCRVLIRSKLDYVSVVFGSARKSYLQMLEPIHNHALCLCFGAFQTSPVSSLHVEANEMSIELRQSRPAA